MFGNWQSKTFKRMYRIDLILADITKMEVDAIVNAANNSLMGGGGVDGAIHRAAGPELQEACRKLKGCVTGQSKLTSGFRLPDRYIIHTVGPVWENGTAQEQNLLISCYKTALRTAIDNGVRTIAFPSISTGAYRFPVYKAAQIAYDTINDYLKSHTHEIQTVYLVCFSDHDLRQYQRAVPSLAQNKI